MNRLQLEHLIRAAATIADDEQLIVIGSQSVLGQFPDAPSELLVSVEADLYPKNRPERAELIDGSIGELSPFHETYGYYAQGVDAKTATLPAGWHDRLIAVSNPNTRGATGWCLEIHDLLLSKYVANRPKDHVFITGAIRHRLAQRQVLLERANLLPLEKDRISVICRQIEMDCAATAGS